MSHLQKLIRRIEKHASIHPDIEAIANRDLDRWLNIEVASCAFQQDIEFPLSTRPSCRHDSVCTRPAAQQSPPMEALCKL